MYRISQVTGSQDNILGVYFSENNSSDIQIIQSNRNGNEKNKNIRRSSFKTSSFKFEES